MTAKAKVPVKERALIARLKRYVSKADGNETFHVASKARAESMGAWYVVDHATNVVSGSWDSPSQLEKYARAEGILKPFEIVEWN
jgi:hypothetical protein